MDQPDLPLGNIITLGVQNFEVQRDFYRQLGWPQAFDSDDFAVFELRGALLALFPIDKLASDATHSQSQVAAVSGSASSSMSTRLRKSTRLQLVFARPAES